MNTHDTLIALRRIMRAVDLHSKRLERTVGLTVPQLLVLQSLDAGAGHTVGEIAGDVHLSQGTVTAMLDRLVAKGLVTRRRSESDRRKVRVTLTPEGVSQVNDAPGLLQDGFIQRFESLASWEQKMLAASLERIAELLDAQHVDASPILDSGELVVKAKTEPRAAAPRVTKD